MSPKVILISDFEDFPMVVWQQALQLQEGVCNHPESHSVVKLNVSHPRHSVTNEQGKTWRQTECVLACGQASSSSTSKIEPFEVPEARSMLWLAPSPALADWASVVTDHQSHTFFEGATTSPSVKKNSVCLNLGSSTEDESTFFLLPNSGMANQKGCDYNWNLLLALSGRDMLWTCSALDLRLYQRIQHPFTSSEEVLNMLMDFNCNLPLLLKLTPHQQSLKWKVNMAESRPPIQQCSPLKLFEICPLNMWVVHVPLQRGIPSKRPTTVGTHLQGPVQKGEALNIQHVNLGCKGACWDSAIWPSQIAGKLKESSYNITKC